VREDHSLAFTYLYGGNVKRTLIAGASALALIASLFVAAPATAATIKLPITDMNACSVANGIYCVESVEVTTADGTKIPLEFVPAGQPVPAAKAPTDVMAPVARVNNGKVVDNNWWMNQYMRETLIDPNLSIIDLSKLLGTPAHPEQGAKYDTKTKTCDITKPMDSYSQEADCWDPTSRTMTRKIFNQCYTGSIGFIVENEVRMIFWFLTPTVAAEQLAQFKASKYIDLTELTNTEKRRPTIGSTYDAATKKFSATEPIIIPIWVTRESIINGWAIAGVATAAPTAADSNESTATDAEKTELAATTANAPEPGVAVAAMSEPGRTLAGRWTHPNWKNLGLGDLGYDGLFVTAGGLGEYQRSWLKVDVLPTLTKGETDKYAVNLAGQVGNKAYAANLDADISIKVKLHIGEMVAGVTFAIGTGVTVDQKNEGEYNTITLSGSPVSVALAAKKTDCSGETGIAKANVRQFQFYSPAQNDDTTGFGVEGTSGDMFVGSNGVCDLSSPVWTDPDKNPGSGDEYFTWSTAAPHFGPDGTTVNKGFYKAVIPAADAALLWGLNNPNDAVTALQISLTTEEGGTSAFTKSISVKNNKIIIDVAGFDYSRPKLKVGIKKGFKPSKAMSNKTTITCVLGKSVKKITNVKPKCPAGYVKKK
jgi:hypothetical protein